LGPFYLAAIFDPGLFFCGRIPGKLIDEAACDPWV